MARRFSALPDPPCGVEKVWHLKMAKSRLGFVHCILEAYEGMAFVSTFDKESAVLEVAVMPGYDDDFQTLLAGLKNETEFEAVRMESRDNARP